MCEEVATRVCGEDPQSLVRLRTGNSKVELSCDLQNGEYGERETTHTEVQENTDVREDVRAVETRSHGKKEETQVRLQGVKQGEILRPQLFYQER